MTAFEVRATELGCSFEWLLYEAMRQLLEQRDTERPPPPPARLPPPCPPPRARKRPEPLGSRILLIVASPHREERFEVDRPVTIGRDGRVSNVVILDESVSKRHAELEQRKGQWWIVDLGSTNGVYVNDVQAREHVLHDNDRIRIGGTLLTVRSR